MLINSFVDRDLHTVHDTVSRQNEQILSDWKNKWLLTCGGLIVVEHTRDLLITKKHTFHVDCMKWTFPLQWWKSYDEGVYEFLSKMSEQVQGTLDGMKLFSPRMIRMYEIIGSLSNCLLQWLRRYTFFLIDFIYSLYFCSFIRTLQFSVIYWLSGET